MTKLPLSIAGAGLLALSACDQIPRRAAESDLPEEAKTHIAVLEDRYQKACIVALKPEERCSTMYENREEAARRQQANEAACKQHNEQGLKAASDLISLETAAQTFLASSGARVITDWECKKDVIQTDTWVVNP